MNFNYFFLGLTAFISSATYNNGKCSELPNTLDCGTFDFRFYYDHQLKRCEKYNYRGCGNKPGFDTLEQCNQSCHA